MDSDFVSNEEIVAAARRKLHQGAWDYLVGGSESEAQVVVRHQRYLALENGRMFRVELPGGEAAGSAAC